MNDKALYCLCSHFKELYESDASGRQADLGKPCAQCKYLRECDFEKGIPNLLEQIRGSTGIRINLSAHDQKEIASTIKTR